MKLTTIKINNAKFYAYHGDLQYEKKYGNQFEVDVEIKCDKLCNTVDYLAVYKLVNEIFGKEKFNLIESLNFRICEEILGNFNLVKEVKVSVRKPNAPLGIIDSIEITHTMKRD